MQSAYCMASQAHQYPQTSCYDIRFSGGTLARSVTGSDGNRLVALPQQFLIAAFGYLNVSFHLGERVRSQPQRMSRSRPFCQRDNTCPSRPKPAPHSQTEYCDAAHQSCHSSIVWCFLRQKTATLDAWIIQHTAKNACLQGRRVRQPIRQTNHF